MGTSPTAKPYGAALAVALIVMAAQAEQDNNDREGGD